MSRRDADDAGSAHRLPDLQHAPRARARDPPDGWRACSTAATHSLDQGQTGVDDTIRALDRAGVAHAGTFSSAAAQQTPLIMTVKGVQVAFLAYTELTNGIPSPHPWSVNRAERGADPRRRAPRPPPTARKRRDRQHPLGR